MGDSSMNSSFVGSLLHFARPHRKAIAWGAAFLVAEALLGLLLPWLGGRFVDTVFGGVTGRGWTFGEILLAVGLLFTVQAALAIVGGHLFAKRAVLISSDIRERTYGHLQSLPLSYFQERRQGEILSVLTNDVSVISHYLSSAVVGILPAIVTGVGSIVLMITIDPWMAGAATLAIPLFYVLIKLVGRGMRPLSQKLQEAWAKGFAIEEENVSLLPVIKAFAREKIEANRHRAQLADIVGLTIKQQWRQTAIGPGMTWAASMGMLAILWVAGERVIGGELGKGALVSFLLYTALLTRPVSAMAGLYGQTQHARAAMDRVQALYSQAGEDYGDQRAAIKVTDGAVEFRNVGFAYPGRGSVLKAFNLHLPARQTIAITGDNGVGKSTLVSLLLRFNVPSDGAVFIDGVDIANVSLESLRRAIGYVSQNVYLVNGTVHENIAFGRPHATREDVAQAAKLAQALTFIDALPGGFDTVIGDQGIRLSGGQRQRVALARVLLLNPPIIVLDEATAMFDPEAELSFLHECAEALADRTVFLITHRPASLALADRVIRLVASSESSTPQVLEIAASTRRESVA
jgi:ATP-binding cassette, subfamily B, bacterial